MGHLEWIDDLTYEYRAQVAYTCALNFLWSPNMQRPSGRMPTQLREIAIQRKFTRHAEGSVLVSFGDTKVICTASIENRVPPFVKEGMGWLTAEYAMLPGSKPRRSKTGL